MLHVAGGLPEFLATVVPEVEAAASPIEVEAVGEAAASTISGEAQPRITKFVPKPRKIGTGYLAKGQAVEVCSELVWQFEVWIWIDASVQALDCRANTRPGAAAVP